MVFDGPEHATMKVPVMAHQSAMEPTPRIDRDP
jgi:hypothetical protein